MWEPAIAWWSKRTDEEKTTVIADEAHRRFRAERKFPALKIFFGFSLGLWTLIGELRTLFISALLVGS
jgi:hypothetical protein